MKQRDLESEMVDLGKARYNSKVTKAASAGMETLTPPGQRLLRESIPQLTEGIKRWKKSAGGKPGRKHRSLEYMDKLPPSVVSALTCRVVLDSISQQRKIASTAIRLGRLLEDEVNFRALKDAEPALWQQMARVLDKKATQSDRSRFIKKTAKYHEVVFERWDKDIAAGLGLTCIELMRQSTGLIDIISKKAARHRTISFIKATDELEEWIREAHKHGELLRPVLLPMVEAPLDWKGVYGGGYIGDAFAHSRPLVKTNSKAYLDELAGCEMPAVYRAVNALQRTPMRINQRVISIMRHCWENGVNVGGLPSVDNQPIPTKPTDIATNEDSRRLWRKMAAEAHFENERQQSKRLQVSKVLWLANKFKSGRIFYPHQLDFRSRDYPLPGFLQPQGPDWSRSMLEFHTGEPVTAEGEPWLGVHLANGWGEDKESYEDRIKWVEDNQDMIMDVAKDPLHCMEWTKADKPWNFLAACFDWRGHRTEGDSYLSHLPCSMDATTQGLQMYALLLRDERAGFETNCLPRDKPGDVYQSVADRTIEKLLASTNPYAPLWLAFGIVRATVKRQSMTLTYGATKFSCRTYTASWFYDELRKDRVNPFGEETYRPCNFLAELVWESIGEIVGSARAGMDWLREVATICMDNNQAIRWFTPNGFLVKQGYKRRERDTVKTVVNGVIRQHRVLRDLDDYDRRKNINALAPNLVHSLDGMGGLLGGTIDLALDQGLSSFSMIHDSYASHAKYSGILQGCVRTATVMMFEKDFLTNFKNQVCSMLPSSVSLPPTPPKGTLDISLVRDSKYYFN